MNGLPKIVIKHQVYNKIRAYADLCNNEISALGTVRVYDNTIYINNIFLFNQKVNGTTTEICQNDLSKFIYQCVKEDIDPSSLKLWWHSHVNMDVFWSPTDQNTIGKFSKEWMVSIVSNKQDKFKVRLDIFSPIRITLDDLPFTVEYNKVNNDAIQAEINEKVQYSSFFSDFVGGRESFFGKDNPAYPKSFISVPGDQNTAIMVETKVSSPQRRPFDKSFLDKIVDKIINFVLGKDKPGIKIIKSDLSKPATNPDVKSEVKTDAMSTEVALPKGDEPKL